MGRMPVAQDAPSRRRLRRLGCHISAPAPATAAAALAASSSSSSGASQAGACSTATATAASAGTSAGTSGSAASSAHAGGHGGVRTEAASASGAQAAASKATAASGPLAGIRIIDLTQMVSGPMATQVSALLFFKIVQCVSALHTRDTHATQKQASAMPGSCQPGVKSQETGVRLVGGGPGKEGGRGMRSQRPGVGWRRSLPTRART